MDRISLGALFVALTALLPTLVFAAEAASYPADPHSLSGIWMNDNTLDETLKKLGLKRLAPGVVLPPTNLANPAGPEVLTPAYRAKYEQRRAAKARMAEGAASCEWVGMPNIIEAKASV